MSKKLIIEIELDNDAFQEDQGAECKRILMDLGDKLQKGRTCGRILDINGNLVGYFETK